MKLFEKPEIEFIPMNVEDVITASSGDEAAPPEPSGEGLPIL